MVKLPLDSSHINKIVGNKFFWTALIFVVYLIFFHDYRLIDQWEDSNKLSQLKERKSWLETQVNNIDSEINSIKSDDKALEKYARERFLMKRQNEDIYIIE